MDTNTNTKTPAKKSLASIVRTLDDRYLKALAKVCSDAGDFDGEILACRALGGSMRAKTEIARTIRRRDWYGPDAVKCVSDVWDPTGETYDDVAGFLATCWDSFGEAPVLNYRDERWYDGDGALILVSLVVDQAAHG
jgi:hypothetical protein